jgi:hypothetical protein
MYHNTLECLNLSIYYMDIDKMLIVGRLKRRCRTSFDKSVFRGPSEASTLSRNFGWHKDVPTTSWIICSQVLIQPGLFPFS